MALPGGRTHKPKPFQRPGITLSTELHGAKKRWAMVVPVDLSMGDIIRGEGLVVGGRTIRENDPKTNDTRLFMVIELKNGKTLHLEAYEPIAAFTEGRGEPIG